MPTLVRAALAGTWPPLAAATVVRDYMYIDDVIDAYIAAASTPNQSPIYNVASGVQTSLAQIVACAAEVFSVAASPVWGGYPNRAWDTRVWVGDATLIRSELGWQATTALSDGMARMAEHLDSTASSARATKTGQARPSDEIEIPEGNGTDSGRSGSCSWFPAPDLWRASASASDEPRTRGCTYC